MNQAERKSQQWQFQADALKREIEREERELRRLRERRADIEQRAVRSEARRQRFLRRLDAEIETAERLKAIAEANLAGLGECDA